MTGLRRKLGIMTEMMLRNKITTRFATVLNDGDHERSDDEDEEV